MDSDSDVDVSVCPDPSLSFPWSQLEGDEGDSVHSFERSPSYVLATPDQDADMSWSTGMVTDPDGEEQ